MPSPGAKPQGSRFGSFRYVRVSRLDDALDALTAEGAWPLAGGTDVVLLRATGALAPSVLVDVKRVPELRALERERDGRRIGAGVTMAALAGLGEPSLAALSDGAALVGAPQTRARATLGGNVCRSSPAGDTLPALLVLGARARLASLDGAREVPFDEFFVGPGANVRRSDELLTGIDLPGLGGGSAYERFTYRRWMDLAVVGVAARIELDADGRCTDGAVAAGAVAPTPILVPAAAAALVGSRVEPEAIEAACEAVVAAADPIDDVRGSRAYRLRVLRPLARRVLARAGENARCA